MRTALEGCIVDLWQTVRVLLRRWYVVVPLALLTGFAARTVAQGVQPGYTISAVAIVLPPSQARVATEKGIEVLPVNPYLSFSGSTQTATKALAIAASGADFRQTLPRQSAVANYSVEVPPREPLLTVDVESRDPAAALSAASDVLEGLRTLLAEQQPAVRPEQELSLDVLSPPAVSAVDNSKLRAAVVTLVVGLLLAVAAAVSVEGLSVHRARRRRAHAPGARPSDTSQTRMPVADVGPAQPTVVPGPPASTYVTSALHPASDANAVPAEGAPYPQAVHKE